MAEELYLEVKTNLGQATKDTKDYKKSLELINEEISIQNEEIVRQERILIKLKAQQDKNSKGGWSAGMGKLNDKIRDTSRLLDLEKNTLKELNNKKKEATQEVKKHTNAQKGNNKESKESIANFQFMGVSLNGIKKGFSQVIPTAKAMFGTIKAGMISTGIGALVIGVMALIQSFKRSEEGQEKFQRIMAAIGAVTSQILDLFAGFGSVIISAFEDPKKALSDFKDFIVENITNRFNAAIDTLGYLGSAIKKVFSGDFSGAMDDAKSAGSSYVDVLTGVEGTINKVTKATKDLVAETSKEVDALIAVTKERQKAHHIDRELKVERAKANREINDLRLQAEDREKNSATERIELLRKAQKIEQDITDKEIKSKQILIDAQKLEMAQGLNTIEQKDKLAQLEADLINLDTKRLRSQRLLQTQITTANTQRLSEIEDEKKALEDLYDAQIAQAKAFEKRVAKAAQDEIDTAKAVKDAKVGIAKDGLSLVSAIAGEGTVIAKGAAVAQATISGVEGVQNAFTTAQKSPLTALMPAYPFIQAGLAGAFSAIQIQKILSGTPAGGGGGGGGGASAVPSTPAPQMMSGAFDISGGVAPEAMKAFVVTDEMSNSQNQLANIRRRATI